MTAPNVIEALVKARLAIDQTRLARLSTQSAIEKSRHSLAEIRTLLDAFAHSPRAAHRNRRMITKGEAATEARKLLAALIKIKDQNG